MKLLRGLGALTVLVLGVVGAPVLLLRAGRMLPLERLVTGFPQVLLAPDNGTVLLAGLCVLGWAAWLVFVASVLVELVALASSRRIRLRLPGMRRPQSLAAGLLVAVAAMMSSSMVADAAPPPAPVTSPRDPVVPQGIDNVGETGTPSRVASPQRQAPAQRRAPAVEAETFRYQVQRGDDLWTIAERFYGDGFAWKRIVAANPGIIESPDVIEIGWRLALPGVRGGDEPRAKSPSVDTTGRRSGINPTDHPGPDQSGRAAGGERAEAPGRETAGPVSVEPELPPPSEAPDAAGSSDVEAGTVAQPSDPTVPESVLWAPLQESSAHSALAAAGVSALTAAAVVALVGARRREQLAQRPVGRRIVGTGDDLVRFETALGQAQDPISLKTLDLALRALGRHHLDSGEPLPAMGAVLVSEAQIRMEVDRVPESLPDCFGVCDSRLVVERAAGEGLAAVPGLADAPSPYPALVVMGHTPEGILLHDLETIGGLTVVGEDTPMAGFLNSVALELACSWWGAGQQVTVVDGDDAFLTAVDAPSVRARRDLEDVLAELESPEGRQGPLPRRGITHEFIHPRDRRIAPDLEEAWRPHVVLIGRGISNEQRTRLQALVEQAEIAFVAVADAETEGSCSLVAPPGRSRLPNGREFLAQIIPSRTRDALVGLLEASSSTATEPAPWWDGSADQEPDNVTSLGSRRPAPTREEPAMDAHEPVLHPTVLLLGPIQLVGTRGEEPSRARRQCIEYCAWLLEHPHATSSMMGNALFVAETTRRSNMSRLRGWLGADPAGAAYLPEAYSGRIVLHDRVTSDWQRLQLLTIGGVDRASDDNLITALELVRGAPLADAAPGQWHWAEELRTDMASVVRDIGVVLAGRALQAGNVDLARWAAARALTASPEDEQLLCARVRTEYRAGNRSEVERLALRLVRHARTLNIDLEEETVELLQQVLEGSPRARDVGA